MKQIKLGIIGVGNMGKDHAKMVAAGLVEGLTLVAVADRDQQRLDWIQENVANAQDLQYFSEGTDLLNSGGCDAVLIATPHYQHPALSLAALEKGLHVLCEKPEGVYTKEVRLLNEKAKDLNPVFALMYNQRTNCLYRKMKEIVENGELGAIKRVNWIITDWYRTNAYYDSGQWRASWRGEGGGVLLNQCPHNLDLLQWICGMPKKVHAFCHYGKWHNIEVEDDVTAYFEFENGATGVLVTTTGDCPGTNRLEITGEMGKLVCENNKLTFHKLSVNERTYCKEATDGYALPPLEVIAVETDGENPQHIGVLKAFASHILNGTPLIANGFEGINGLTISNAMHLSSWTGQTITLPLDEDLYYAELQKRIEGSTCRG